MRTGVIAVGVIRHPKHGLGLLWIGRDDHGVAINNPTASERNADRLSVRGELFLELGAFHDYLRVARFSDELYEEVTRALTGPFRPLPLLTIFGEKNDPLGFQPQWKQLFPTARQVTVPKGNHFPMCDDPDLVAQSIREWHRDLVMKP